MDFILSKIISRPPRSDRDNCDITAVDATADILSIKLINNGLCDAQLSSEIDTVIVVRLIVDLVRFL